MRRQVWSFKKPIADAAVDRDAYRDTASTAALQHGEQDGLDGLAMALGGVALAGRLARAFFRSPPSPRARARIERRTRTAAMTVTILSFSPFPYNHRRDRLPARCPRARRIRWRQFTAELGEAPAIVVAT